MSAPWPQRAFNSRPDHDRQARSKPKQATRCEHDTGAGPCGTFPAWPTPAGLRCVGHQK